MNLKLIGGILLVTGTSIGAGMLALPVACATNGLISSSLLMIVCWAVMTLGALYILETNLKFSVGVNLVTMARNTLGKSGAAVTWIVNLSLFYALLSAYITGGGQVTQHGLQALHINFSLAAILFTLVMGFIVLRGIRAVDYSNRALMTIKSLALILLILAVFPHSQWAFASFGNQQGLLSAATVMITSFGYASIIPSLRIYFKEDISLLKKSIIIGSIIPLFIYIIWNVAVHSALPVDGPFSLLAMQKTGNASSQLAIALTAMTHSTAIKIFANIFTSICVFTSFLGVGLALSDFLSDGLSISKNTSQGLLSVAALTFLLPLLVALFFPKAFIVALSYAGILCIVLLMLLPILMAWAGRVKFASAESYQVFGGKKLMAIAFLLTLFALALSVIFL